jgi:anti-anti-sigma regulatory factor
MTIMIDTTTDTSPNAAPTASRNVTRLPVHTYPLPRRFDVHQVERVTTELAGLIEADDRVALDGTDVEMIDLSALAALGELASDNARLRFVNPSVALRATMAYTGHDLLTARCTVPALIAAA